MEKRNKNIMERIESLSPILFSLAECIVLVFYLEGSFQKPKLDKKFKELTSRIYFVYAKKIIWESQVAIIKQLTQLYPSDDDLLNDLFGDENNIDIFEDMFQKVEFRLKNQNFCGEIHDFPYALKFGNKKEDEDGFIINNLRLKDNLLDTSLDSLDTIEMDNIVKSILNQHIRMKCYLIWKTSEDYAKFEKGVQKHLLANPKGF